MSVVPRGETVGHPPAQLPSHGAPSRVKSPRVTAMVEAVQGWSAGSDFCPIRMTVGLQPAGHCKGRYEGHHRQADPKPHQILVQHTANIVLPFGPGLLKCRENVLQPRGRVSWRLEATDLPVNASAPARQVAEPDAPGEHSRGLTAGSIHELLKLLVCEHEPVAPMLLRRPFGPEPGRAPPIHSPWASLVTRST